MSESVRDEINQYIIDALSDETNVAVDTGQIVSADNTKYVSMTSYIIMLTLTSFLSVAIPLSLASLFPSGLIITGNSWYVLCVALAFVSAFIVDWHFTSSYDFNQPDLSLPLRSKNVNNVVVMSSILSGMLFCVMTIVVFLSYDEIRLANVGEFAYGTPTPLLTLLIEIAIMSLMLPLAICSNEITDALEDVKH